MRIGSLFSGGGGLDMAVEQVFSGHTVWHCELDPAASKVLAHRWPGVPNLGDITKVDWTSVKSIDVLCGGWPCQPWSAAGKQLGEADERALWPEVARAVRALRPRYIVLENVPTVIVLRELARAVGDLAAIGYDAQWCCVSAASIGAPHRRERVFILAADTDIAAGRECIEPGTQNGTGRGGEGQARQDIRADTGGCSGDAADSSSSDSRRLINRDSGSVTPDSSRDGRHEGRPQPARLIGESDAAVSSGGPVNLLPTPAAQRSGRNKSPSPGAAIRPSLDSINDLLPTPNAVDAIAGSPERPSRADRSVDLPTVAYRLAVSDDGLLPTPRASDRKGTDNETEWRRHSPGLAAMTHHLINLADAATTPSQWGKYEPAIRRWEHLTRPAPAPTEPNKNGNPRLAAAFSEWLMGWPEGWVTAVPGVIRNGQLRIVGNGVVPQCAAAALQYLLSISERAA